MASTIPMSGTGAASGMMAASAAPSPTSPINFLIAAADQSAGSDPHRSAPVPKGHALQTGAKPGRAAIKVVK